MSYLDIHLHALPGVDDGPEEITESLLLLKGMTDLGFSAAVVTFHLDADHEDRSGIAEKSYNELRKAASDQGGIGLSGYTAEHRIDPLFLRNYNTGRVLCYPGTRFVLVEGTLGPAGLPPNLNEILFRLHLKGLRPILAHPERYDTIQADPGILSALRDGGTWMQLDLQSLVSGYGRAAEKAAKQLLEKGLYDVAASDLHHAKDLDQLGRSLEALASQLGQEEVERLLGKGPAEVAAWASGETTR